MMLVLAVTALLLGEVLGYPAQDTEVVGSSVHQSRVAPPQDMQEVGDHSGGAAGDDGYHHSHNTKGGDGYQHFDSFHKKDGDSYGYEKHSAFGHGGKGDDGGGEYHQSSSYDSGDGGSSGSRHKPKVTSYHFESKSGTPRDYSNYDPETYEGDYTEVSPRTVGPVAPRTVGTTAPRTVGPEAARKFGPVASRRPHPDVEVTGPLRGEQYQTLYDLSRQTPGAKRKVNKPRRKNKDPQTAGTEDDAEYDYYDGEEGEGDDGGYDGELEAEGGDYEGEGESESDYYY